MYCVKCGTKSHHGDKFCFNCGAKLVSVNNDTQNIDIHNTSNSNADASIDKVTRRVDIFQNCNEIKFGGATDKFAYDIVFKNEYNMPIIYAKSSAGFVNHDFSFSKDEQGNEVIMTTKSDKSSGDPLYKAYDVNQKFIGEATINGYLKSMVKVNINIKNIDGIEYSITEELRGAKKASKMMSMVVPDYGIGKLIDSRTGDMIIKKENINIGIIKSKRGATYNTYTVLNVMELKKHIDVRLLILALVLKITTNK
ncbi:hypothetical protein [Clostridium sp. DL1XJH146]